MDPKVKLEIPQAKIPEIVEAKQPEIPKVQPPRIDKSYTRKADRECKLNKPAGCEFPPAGTCIMDLPKKERKKYMWMLPDELKDHPMYDMEPEECKIDVCKMKREEKEEEAKREKRERKDQDEKKSKIIQDQSITINTLQNQIKSMMTDVSSLHSALSQVIQELNNMKAK